jgi:chromosome segregation ATPase
MAMNVLAAGPTLIRRLLDELGAVGEAARQLESLRTGLLGRLDTLIDQLELVREDVAPLRAEMQPIQLLAPVRAEIEALRVAIEPLGEKLDRLRDEVQPIQDLSHVRAGIEPLDEDMRRVRESIDAIEPRVTALSAAVERVDGKLGNMGADLTPVAELAEKMPGVSRR